MHKQKIKRFSLLAGLTAGVGALLLLVNSCSTPERRVVAPLTIEGAEYVGDKACADCHDKINRVFPASTHGRLHSDKSSLGGWNGCESCHGPGSKHIAAGGSGGRFIINPGKEPKACLNCHLETQAQFHLPQHHPVLEGKMNCVQCHDPHGMDIMKPHGGLAMARENENCAQCHQQQTRPFTFEHAAMREGCTSCHNPHGSINAKMLTIRDSNLCLRCHAQNPGPGTGGSGNIYIGNINHTGYVRVGTCWTAGCHSAVHGSNIQPFYLY